MFSGPISSISGCFLWYESTSMSGLPNGNTVQYWQDLSGSGNHLTPFNGSGSTPVFYNNIINGYPVVRFSGLQGLTTATPNQSTLNTNSNLSIFTVFSTSVTGIQMVCGADSGTQESRISFIIELDGTNNLTFEDSSSQIIYSSGLPVNQFILRNDHYDKNTNQVIISYFGQDIASGLSSVTTTFNPGFNIGFSPYSSNVGLNFKGDIAEILAYQQPLSASNTALVNDYLRTKYFSPSNTGSTTPPFQIPTDISGCFLWIKPDLSTGLTVAGSHIFQLNDLSGSGNILTPAVSSTAASPIFYPNIINGYPIIRFSGGDYLQGSSNVSVECTANNFACFAVLSTNGVGNQSVLTSAKFNNSFLSNIVFSVAISSTNPAFYNSWFNPGIVANSSVPTNQFFLMSDWFDNSSNFSIDYFKTPLLTQNATLAGNLPAISIGHNPAGGFQNWDFRGDIAEIAAWDVPLSSGDVNNIQEYFINKYFGPNSGTTPPSQIPTDISGLFGWYKSTSIGITGVDGSPVQYWPDNSGSGNHLFIPNGNSGTWSPPNFYRNEFNIYPSVRFSNAGNTSYLSTNSGNQSLNFSSKDFAGFIVFKTNDVVDNQCLYSIDSLSNPPCLSVEINDSGNNSFAFGGSSGNTSYNFTYANNTNLGTNVYSADTTVIRHDRFRQSDGTFMFGLYGADIASGVTTTNFNSNNSLQIGYSFIDGNPFLGDIAEIVLYRRELSNTEVDLVNTYLTNKYLPNNTNTTSLFIHSTINSGIYNDTTLYMIAAQSSTYDNIPLYVGSTMLGNSGVSMYEISTGYDSGIIPLYTAGFYQQYPPITLFLGANFTNSGNIPLYTIVSVFSQNTNTLYINGTDQYNINNIPMYTAGFYQQYPPITLFLSANYPYSNNIPLYTASVSPTGSLSKNFLSLYVSGTTNRNIVYHTSLFLANTNSFGSTASGLYQTTPLYLEAGKLYQSLPLYLSTFPINTNPSGFMSLFVGTPYYTGYNNSLSLYLGNSVSGVNSITKRLYTKGTGGLNGGSIATSQAFNLFTQATGVDIISNNLPMYIESAPNSTGNFSLYIGAILSQQSGISLYTNPFIQQNTTHDGFFSSNYMDASYFRPSYFDLLIGEGINTKSKGMTLSITGSGNLPSNNINIYTGGY